MSAPQLIGALDEIFDQHPMRLLVSPSLIRIVYLRNLGGSGSVVMLKTAIHVARLAGFRSVYGCAPVFESALSSHLEMVLLPTPSSAAIFRVLSPCDRRAKTLSMF